MFNFQESSLFLFNEEVEVFFNYLDRFSINENVVVWNVGDSEFLKFNVQYQFDIMFQNSMYVMFFFIVIVFIYYEIVGVNSFMYVGISFVYVLMIRVVFFM